ncbi:mechanosensitive ion channel [Lentisphaera profundi]|uniref:Mechanosensitive ion channel n=1 Tax=Lentisphaera profundi TaxID=1658616 RepID=A0ABY7VPW1_9BACT|nr:mechanosensitive ion channel domain-containing protein [Lentisphaera profundi]WDE96216.1 mechanosensitive ion channel [Lentisphaera profundi]
MKRTLFILSTLLLFFNYSLFAQSGSTENIQEDLTSFEGQVKSLKDKKDSLSAKETQTLQNLQKAIALINQTLDTNKRINSLKKEIALAPEQQADFDQQLLKFKALKVNQSQVDKLDLTQLETAYKKHKESGLNLKEKFDISTQNIVKHQQIRDTIQEKILKNVERISALNKKSSDPGDTSSFKEKYSKYELIKLDAENKLFRLQQSSFSTLNKRRNALKSLLGAQYANFEETNKFWSAYILKRRSQEVNKQEKVALSESQQMMDQSPEIKLVFNRNVVLLQKLKELNQLRATVNAQLKVKNEKFDFLKNNFNDTKDMLTRRILNEVVGVALRQKFTNLSDLSEDGVNKGDTLKIMSELERDMLMWRQELKSLNHIPQKIDALLVNNKKLDDPLRKKLTSTFSDQRNYILQIQDASQLYFDKVHALHALNEQLKLEVESYKTYIKGHLFWIPSSEVLNLTSLKNLPDDFESVFLALSWGNLSDRYKSSWLSYKWTHITFILVFFFLLIFRFLYLKLLSKDTEISKVQSFKNTLKFFLSNTALSLLVPTCLYYFSFALSPQADSSAHATISISHSFKALSIFYFFTFFIASAMRPNGLGVRCFGWDKELSANYFKLISLWLYIVAPFIFLGQLSNKVYDAHIDNISKFGIISNVLLVFAIFVYTFINRKKFLPEFEIHAKAHKLLKLAYFSSILVMSSILVLAFQGYFYSAFILKNLTVRMGIHCIIIFFLSSLIQSYLLRRRQKLAELSVRKKLAIKETEKLQLQHEVLIEQQEKILENEMVETRRGYSSLLKILFFAGVFYIWQVFFPALNILDQYTLWTHTVEVNEAPAIVQITVKNLLTVFIFVIATFYCSSALPNILKVFILNKLSFDQGQKFTIVTLLQYLIITVGLFYSFEKLGVNWSEFQWLIAALSVGLGFGLQEIVANFVSGLIVLFERPYRVGDIVTVGQTSGTVSKIQIRATTIRDWDRRELIIPNKSFITGEFINWSLSDSISRVVIAIKVQLDSDVKRVHKLLEDLGEKHPNTLDEPKPQVFITDMASDGISFELRVFVPASKYRLTTKDELLAAIHGHFEEQNIQISSPHYKIDLNQNSSI